MQQSEWERRKAHLIRSMFVDLPPLSPVPEEDSPSQVSTEPFSPLPELTIERIKPVNKHDEPEEFYVDLERKMKKVHRHLFFNERSEEAEELLRRYEVSFQETSSSRDDMDRSIRETHSLSEYHDSTTLDQSCFKEAGSIIVSDPMIVEDNGRAEQIQDKLDQYAIKDQTDTSSLEANGVQVITCLAQIHREQSGDDKEEEASYNLDCIPRKVTKRGEFIEIEISGLNEDDTTEDGGKRGSIPGVIDLDKSDSMSNDSPEIMRHYNTRHHSMGSIRLSGEHGRGSSLLHDNITRSRTLDPELEACDTTEVSDVKISIVRKYSAEYSDEHGKVWTDTDTEADSNESEEEASGIVTSTPKTKQREKSPSKSRSPKPKSLPKSKSQSQSQSGTLTSDDGEQDILNTAVISKDLTYTSIDNELNPARRSSFSKGSTTSLEGSGKKRTSSIGLEWSGEKGRSASRLRGRREKRTSTFREDDNEEKRRKTTTKQDSGEQGTSAISSEKRRRIMDEARHEKRTSTIRSMGSGGKRSKKRRVEGSGGERTTAVAKGRKEKRKRVPEETIYWDDIKNNLFVGEPKVYKLCSCQDHVCNK